MLASKSKGSDAENADNIVRLLHNPKKPDEFLDLVEKSVDALSRPTSAQKWRITVTTAEGGRGHDYRVVDPEVDQKGGLLLICTWVPWSEREWCQFLGRTGRQDRKGQYVVYLNEDDLADAMAEKTGDEKSMVDTVLRLGEEDAHDRIAGRKEEITKGMIMHQLTSRFWAIDRATKLSKEQSWKWKKLCETYRDGDEVMTQEKFDLIFPPGQDDQGVPAKLPQRARRKKGKEAVEYFQGPSIAGSIRSFSGDGGDWLAKLHLPANISEKLQMPEGWSEAIADTREGLNDRIQDLREKVRELVNG
jgi:hypothetical protein